MDLNQEFLIETLYSYCKRPIHKKYQNVFNSECPICKEGKSAGRSRRMFYFPHKEYFYCHNCAKAWRPLEWIKDVTGWTFPEIVKRNNEKQGVPIANIRQQQQPEKQIELPDLPENSIDLSDQSQVSFYKNNKYVKLAIDYCNNRRLFRAVNSCKRFYVSIEDKVHKNRLVIPFFNQDHKVVSYQTRALTKEQFPKYLTKFGEKELYGMDSVTDKIPYVFIFEGPIDSMFVQNGVAMASLSPTEKQMQQLSNLIGYEQIWVFDNDKNNKQTSKKILKNISEGKKIFIWPKELSKFKDFNEVCCSLDLDEIPWKFVAKHSAKGQEAQIKQRMVN